MIKIDQNYTDYRDDSDLKYPGGKAVNATTSEGTDGTPLLADWMNDINGTRQAIFIEAFGDINGVSGKPDNVQESDVLKSIKKITQEYTDKTNNAESQARAQGDENALKSARSYTDQKTPKTFFNHNIRVPGAGWYRLARFQDGRDGRGYISMTIRSGDGDLPPENMTIFASACWGGYDYKGGIVAICPYFLGNIAQFRIVSNKLGSEKYLEAFFSRGMWCNFHAEDNYYNPVIYGEAGGLPLSSNDLTVVRNGFLKMHNGVCSSVDDGNSALIEFFRYGGYIQWPGMPIPENVINFDGYRWAEVNYNGCFFRAKGAGALPFDGGEQGDAIRNLKGFFNVFAKHWTSESQADGTLFKSSPGRWEGATLPMEYYNSLYDFDASRIVPTAEENRSRNRTFIIWQLKKI